MQTSEDPRQALDHAIGLGGDTDTTVAIAGARVGAAGLPSDWLAGVRDWPVSTDSLRELAQALSHGASVPRQRWLASIPRNPGLVLVIVGHVTLRLLGR